MRLFLLIFSSITASAAVVYNVTVDTFPARTIPEKFLSFSIDSFYATPDLWKQLDFSIYIPLASALAPAYFRWGGTAADLMIFQQNYNGSGFESPPECLPNSIFANSCAVITDQQFETLYNFSKNAGVRFIYDLNLMLRNGSGWTGANIHNSVWNSSNAQEIINYATSRGFDMDWELGNEPDGFPVQFYGLNLTGSQVVQAFQSLRSILNSNSLYENSLLIGPSACCMSGEINSFINANGGQYVSALTAHHYYFSGKGAKLDNFTNPKIMDKYSFYLDEYLKEANNYAPLWNGETSTAYGGGTAGLSDRYVAGFLWLDKLGLSALMGMEVVVRQALVGGGYCLIDPGHANRINPDYWLTFLYKKLIGKNVFRVTLYGYDPNLRLYASSSRYSNSSVLYGINVGNFSISLDLPLWSSKQVTLYVLTTGQEGNLESEQNQLNGQLLSWKPHEPVTNMEGVIANLPVTLPSYSQFFIVQGEEQNFQCSKGWYKEATVSNKCVKFVNGLKNPWFAANFDCKTHGMNASSLSISSAFENSELAKQATSSGCDQFYIGLYRNGSNWQWANNDSSAYKNWAPGYPTNDPTQNCVIFNSKSGTWSNIDCDSSHCFVCQKLL